MLQNDHDSDALSQILSPMRIAGSVLLADRYAEPWGIAIPDAATLAQMMEIGPSARVVVFHLASQGTFDIVGAQPRRTVAAGEIVLCVNGTSHTISSGQTSVVPLQTVLVEGNPFHGLGQGRHTGTTLVCGAFILQHTRLNPLFDALPSQMLVNVFDAAHQTPASTVAELFVAEVLQQRQGRQYAVERYLELLCIEVIRTYMNTTKEDARGWLRGMQDPLIQTSLAYIHERPNEMLSVPLLADLVNLSPSRFTARFRSAMQESPMAYVARWRLYRASYLLRQPGASVEDVAIQVGYHDSTAFGRAFRRYFGQSPTTWRDHPLDGIRQGVA